MCWIALSRLIGCPALGRLGLLVAAEEEEEDAGALGFLFFDPRGRPRPLLAGGAGSGKPPGPSVRGAGASPRLSRPIAEGGGASARLPGRSGRRPGTSGNWPRSSRPGPTPSKRLARSIPRSIVGGGGELRRSPGSTAPRDVRESAGAGAGAGAARENAGRR